MANKKKTKKNRFREESKKESEGFFRSTGRGLSSFFRGIHRRARDPRTRKILGSLCLLLAFYFAIAFTSYLFTWEVDQDKVTAPHWWSFLMDPEVQVENWLGKLGALLSHFFIFNWFGVSSFLFIPLLLLLGVRGLFRVSLLGLKRSLPILLFLLLWGSVILAFFFQERFLYLGGGFGREVNLWLHALLGGVGTGFFLAFLLGGFGIAFFDRQLSAFFHRLRLWIMKEGPADEDEATEEEDEEIPEPYAIETEESSEEAPADASSEKEKEEEEPFAEEEGVDGGNPDPEESTEKAPETIRYSPEEAPVEEEAEEKAEDELEGSEEEGFSVAVAEGDEEATEAEIAEKVREFGEFDPRLELKDYQMPPINLLEDHGSGKIEVNEEELKNNKERITETFRHFKIEISEIKATVGPALTLYEIKPAPGIKVSKIRNLQDDIALSLAAEGIRIIAPIPGRGTIGIEVPNSSPQMVGMRSLIASEAFQNSDMELPMALGKNIQNETWLEDLTKMPHLLVAGATGQGKSVGLNVILTSLLYKRHPSQVKFVMVDPKRVELTLYHKLERHFLAKLPDEEEAIVSDVSKAAKTLKSLCKEMDERYELLKDAGVRGIKDYNKKFIKRRLNPENGHRYLPYIVLVVDEFADLIMTTGREVEDQVARLAQLARAVGIHLIIATQRPSTDVITGKIKANFPARIAFRVLSHVDSGTILDSKGAERLIGKGDMLLFTGKEPVRLQCAFLDTPEVEAITNFIGEQRGYAQAYPLPEVEDQESEGGGVADDEERDALFEEAARLVVQNQQGSTSLIQRKLKLGYNRAGRIMDQLEAGGVVGAFKGSKSREVLIPDEESLERFLNQESDSAEGGS